MSDELLDDTTELYGILVEWLSLLKKNFRIEFNFNSITELVDWI
jgi:hypothetical protein